MELNQTTGTTQQAVCPICGNPANKTNTHLIPWFIIKHYITQDGTGIRDKELSFTISSGHFTKMFAGRSVLPEKLEEFGELHELEKENSNPYSRDYLWCNACEEKFSRLEAIFASRFPESKLRQQIDKLDEHKGQHILINGNFDNSVYEIFVHSVFWRCSYGKFDGFTLNAIIEEKLRENLSAAFQTPGFNKLRPADKLPVLHRFPLITSHLYAEAGEDPTRNFILINKARNPYFIQAGKWLFQLFEKEKHIRGNVEWLYGLSLAIDAASLYPKVAGRSHLLLLNEVLTESFRKNRLDVFTEEKTRGLQRDIREIHLKFFKHKANAFIQHYIQQQYFIHREEGMPEFESFVHAFRDLKKLP